MKTGNLLFALLLLASTSLVAQQSERTQSLKNDVEKARKAFLKSDPSISKFFDSAAGYVIFPNVGKGGLLVGGGAGNGIVFADGQAIGRARLTMVSLGLQAGGQAYREVIFFENDESLERFKQSNFELSKQISAIASTTGVASTTAYTEGMVVFTLPKKGLMTEISLNGQKFSFTPFEKE